MKKKFFLILAFAGFIGLMSFPGCDETEEAGPFTLNVVVSEGINGAPATGTYTYENGTLVTYDYSLKDKYGKLTVTLDGVAAATAGTVTMDNNHDLNASALINVRGDDWIGLAHIDGEPAWKKYGMELRFTGDITLGWVNGEIDGPGHVSGTWTFDGTTIEMSLIADGSPLTMTGTFSDENHMSGIFDVTTDHYMTGTWELHR